MAKQTAANNKFLATIKPAIATGMYKRCVWLVNYAPQDRLLEYLFANFSDVTVWGWLFAAQDWSEFQRSWQQMIIAMTNEIIGDNYSYPASKETNKFGSNMNRFRAEVKARRLFFEGKWNGKDRMRILEWTLANEECVEGVDYTIEREQAIAQPASDSANTPADDKATVNVGERVAVTLAETRDWLGFGKVTDVEGDNVWVQLDSTGQGRKVNIRDIERLQMTSKPATPNTQDKAADGGAQRIAALEAALATSTELMGQYYNGHLASKYAQQIDANRKLLNK
jgi:hypothetical protein